VFLYSRDRKVEDGDDGRHTKFGLRKVSPELPEMTLIVIYQRLVLALFNLIKCGIGLSEWCMTNRVCTSNNSSSWDGNVVDFAEPTVCATGHATGVKIRGCGGGTASVAVDLYLLLVTKFTKGEWKGG
jgi:hypothetical protein